MGGGDGSATICRDQMLSAGRRAHCRVDCRLTKGGKMMRRGGDPRTRMRCGFVGRDGARNGLHGRGSLERSPRARQAFEKLRKQLRRQAQSAPGMTHVEMSRIRSAPACLCRGSRSTAGSCGVCFHPACQNRTSARSGLGQRTFQPRRASDLFTSQHDLRRIPFSRPPTQHAMATVDSSSTADHHAICTFVLRNCNHNNSHEPEGNLSS